VAAALLGLAILLITNVVRNRHARSKPFRCDRTVLHATSMTGLRVGPLGPASEQKLFTCMMSCCAAAMVLHNSHAYWVLFSLIPPVAGKLLPTCRVCCCCSGLPLERMSMCCGGCGAQVTWKESLDNNAAWDTLTWFAALIGMASYLNKYGFIAWFSNQVQYSPSIGPLLMSACVRCPSAAHLLQHMPSVFLCSTGSFASLQARLLYEEVKEAL
jgi:hypothetical protein